MNPVQPSASSVLPHDVQAVTDLTLTVFRLNGALLQWGDMLVEPLGLTSARWQVLGAIALADRAVTAPQIADTMGVTRQGTQKQLNLLLELGLLEIQPNPAHRRSPLYALTPQGKQLYAQAEARWATQAADLAASLSPADIKNASVLLGAVLRHAASSLSSSGAADEG